MKAIILAEIERARNELNLARNNKISSALDKATIKLERLHDLLDSYN